MKIPESREVREHGDHVYDRTDARLTKLSIFILGMIAGVALVTCVLAVAS